MELSFKKIRNGFLRRFFKSFKFHPVSDPYISGDSFRSTADHIFDDDVSFNPLKVKRGDVIFVQSSKILNFFSNIHPYIRNRYILITHNGDENIDDSYISFVDEKIIHWFAQNCLASHPKLTPLPIGLENKRYYLHGMPRYFDKLRTTKVSRKNKILYKFSVSTNKKEREDALGALKASPLAETYNEWKDPYSYMSTVRDFAFVASPPGNGEDCIRTWEAMYLGTIPIVKSSPMTEYFRSLGLPLFVIKEWSDIANLNEAELRKIYATIATQKDFPPLWIDYWIKEIRSKATT